MLQPPHLGVVGGYDEDVLGADRPLLSVPVGERAPEQLFVAGTDLLDLLDRVDPAARVIDGPPPQP